MIWRDLTRSTAGPRGPYPLPGGHGPRAFCLTPGFLRGTICQATFTTGLPLSHHGWFDVHIESIRPIPKDGAPAGMPLRELTMTGVGGVGAVDGYGESSVPRDARRPVKGYVIPPDEGAHEKQYAFGLATWEIVESGRWTYAGYEIVYRHGPVRHRMQIPMGTEACTLSKEECDL